jgi:hypothetical protein
LSLRCSVVFLWLWLGRQRPPPRPVDWFSYFLLMMRTTTAFGARRWRIFQKSQMVGRLPLVRGLVDHFFGRGERPVADRSGIGMRSNGCPSGHGSFQVFVRCARPCQTDEWSWSSRPIIDTPHATASSAPPNIAGKAFTILGKACQVWRSPRMPSTANDL